ncbi:hypothetical protein, partial [Accumulibacter sp.]|uniref:hypothetical protein n=1 Tax=Accumulibacter sp. TaxID=2053492 RepID=UPI002633CF38
MMMRVASVAAVVIVVIMVGATLLLVLMVIVVALVAHGFGILAACRTSRWLSRRVSPYATIKPDFRDFPAFPRVFPSFSLLW